MDSIVKQPAIARFASYGSASLAPLGAFHTQTRLRSPSYATASVRQRPVFCPASGRAGLRSRLPSSSSPKGRAEHRAFHRARGATWVNHVAAVCERHTAKMVASDAVRRLRSAREWISRLAPCPRRRRFRLAFPFVRAVARTCTWAVRPCCRRLSLLPLSGGTLLTASQGSGIVAATASRYPRRGDDRSEPRKGAGWRKYIPRKGTGQE